jgi:phosphatidylethanolamine N-methyltransferase
MILFLTSKLAKLIYYINMDTLNILLDYIDLKDKDFQLCIHLTTLNLVLHGLLPTLQYKYKLISKFTGDDLGRAADFLAYLLIHIGTMRNYAFFEAVYSSQPYELGFGNILASVLGVLSILIGSFLVLLCFKKLGLRGMYFGDHFGFASNKITSFPYNYLENPQYIGSVLVYFGVAIFFRSVTGVLLTLTIILFYQILFYLFEKKRLREIYNDEKKLS